ncbi:Uncharacterised protein [Candidatus Gugararchaeum adminiculabundum]|nr:Uncharacterised protein [Candidatus Gugararchaeum adminiculabundum]
MLPKQVISFEQLLQEGYTKKQITDMYSGLKLFPTPFKGIYYVPLPEERRGQFIESPLRVLSGAIALFLKSNDFYYSCSTAQEALGISWAQSNQIHVVNKKMSARLVISDRIKRNNEKGTYRAKKIAKLLSYYGNEIVFHERSRIEKERIRQTPYGKFASKAQINADLRRFGYVLTKREKKLVEELDRDIENNTPGKLVRLEDLKR